jgi:hypothetical protein
MAMVYLLCVDQTAQRQQQNFSRRRSDNKKRKREIIGTSQEQTTIYE